jgi:hypothetical protein
MQKKPMSAPNKLNDADGGFSAVWIAFVLLFLVGATALAVDVSEFYQQARQEQTTADLACLAGVRHAPSNPALAVEKAASFLRPNHDGLRSINPTLSDSGAPSAGVNTWTSGDFVVEVETPVNGQNTQMRVTVRQGRDARFGRVLGADQVDVVQEAYCEVGSPLNLGDLPLALDLASADECENTGQGCQVKFTGSSCVVENGPGNCGSIDIPRHDEPTGSGGFNRQTEYELNLALGANWTLQPGNTNVCRNGANTAEPCGRFHTVPGNKPPQLTSGLLTGSQGFAGRLDRDAPHNQLSYPGPISWDGHVLGDVASCDSSLALGVGCQDPGGEDDTTYPATIHRVFDCTDPRWSAVPVIAAFGPGSNPVDYLRSIFSWIQEPDMATNDPDQINDPVHPGESEFAAANKVQIVAIRPLSFANGGDIPIDNIEECGFFQFEENAPAITRLIPTP